MTMGKYVKYRQLKQAACVWSCNVYSLRHGRQLDKQPAGARYTSPSKVLPGDIPGSVEVGIELETALPAPEKGLRTAVGPVNISTAGTRLGSVPRINPFDLTSRFLGLVLQEGAHLSEGPRVQAAVGPPAPLFSPATDVCQILHRDGSARGYQINDAAAQHMVAVSPEAVDLPGQLAEMPFGRGGAFGLEAATEPEVSMVNRPPTAGAEELVVGRHRGAHEPQVYADNLAIILEGHVGESYHRMEPPVVLLEYQVGAIEADGLLQQSGGVGVQLEQDSEPPLDRGQGNDTLLSKHPVGAGIVSDGDAASHGTIGAAALALADEGRLDRFGGPYPGGADQLGGKAGVLRPERIVRGLVELDPVLLSALPAVGGYGVETSGALSERVVEVVCLLWRRGQFQPDSALHTHILADSEQGGKGAFLCRFKPAVSSAHVL
mgnify:CR=1 FL=1